MPGLFALIAGTLAAEGINILSAQIHTRADGIAIDTFQVNDPFGEAVTEDARWRRTLGRAPCACCGASSRWRSCWPRAGAAARPEAVAGPPKISVGNQLSDTHTVVEVKCPDRVGLLYLITRTFQSLGLDIGSARIATEIEQAYDTFYVTGRQGRRVEDPAQMDRLRDCPGRCSPQAAIRSPSSGPPTPSRGSCSAPVCGPTTSPWPASACPALAAWAFADGRLRTERRAADRGRALRPLRRLAGAAVGAGLDFGAFLDSVVDRYSDLVVLLGLIVYCQRIGEWTLCVFTMATLVGTVMVSYTKARAQSIGISCEIGLMERPERLIVLIAGATFHLMAPAMVVLEALTHLTALQRIFYTRRVARTMGGRGLSGRLLACGVAGSGALSSSPWPRWPWPPGRCPISPRSSRARPGRCHRPGSGHQARPRSAGRRARLFGEAAAMVGPIPEYALYLQADTLRAAPGSTRLPARPPRRWSWPAQALCCRPRCSSPRASLRGSATRPAPSSCTGVSSTAIPSTATARRRASVWPTRSKPPVRVRRRCGSSAASGSPPRSPPLPAARDRERSLTDRGCRRLALTRASGVDRAERLLAGARPPRPGSRADALIAEGIGGDPLLRALRVTAEASRRLGKSDEALRAVDRAIAAAPGERRATWLLERARLQQTRTPQAAIVTLDRLVREHPRSSEASDALLLRAQLLEAQAQPVEAEATYARLVLEYGDDDDAGRALWRLGWMSWFRRDSRGRDGAVESAHESPRRPGLPRQRDLLDRPGLRGAGRARPGHRRQWMESVGREPRGYFGILATARLQRRGAAVPIARELKTPITLPADALEPLREEPRYAKATALRGAGLGAWADGELEEVARRSAGEAARLYAVSALFAQDARHHLSLRILRREFLPLARAGYPWLPRPFWDMFYPLGWRVEIATAAQRGRGGPAARLGGGARGVVLQSARRAPAWARGVSCSSCPIPPGRSPARGAWTSGTGDLLDDPAANVELGGGLSRVARSRVRRSAAGGGRVQCRAQSREGVVGGAEVRRPRGVGGADPLQRDAQLRPARVGRIRGVPPPLRGRRPVSVQRAGIFRRLAAGLLGHRAGPGPLEPGRHVAGAGRMGAARAAAGADHAALCSTRASSASASVSTSSTTWWCSAAAARRVGRMALRIAVVRSDGRAPGYGRAALRSLGNLVTALTLGLAALIALFNREGRDLADLLSGTRVVRLR